MEVKVARADLEAAKEWGFMECRHCSEYEGNFVDDLAVCFAAHRTASQIEALDLLKEVLAGACVNYAYIAPRNIERIKKLVGEA